MNVCFITNPGETGTMVRKQKMDLTDSRDLFMTTINKNLLSYGSKAKNAKKRKLHDLQNEVEECSKKLKKTEELFANESRGREPSEQRAEALALLDGLGKEEDKLKKELQRYRDSDPEYIANLKKEIQDLKTAVNRWTENIYILKSYIKNTFQMENVTVDESFNIPADLDYIDV